MTLLGILFVVGVAFLATMNFEADMISAERLRSQSDGGVEAAAETAGSIISNSVMAGPGMPFGDSSAALSGTAFAELPGVQNTFSPIEPIRRIGPDGLPFTGDDTLVFEGYFDAQAHSKTSFDGPSLPAYFAIDTNLVNGTAIGSIFITVGGAPVEIILGRCKGAPDDGNLCDPTNPCTAPSVCDYPRVADADGDGIVDSLLIDAREMGLSDAQLVDLAARVNPPGDLNGQVSVALRVVPHGGMVNLNESHPSLIQNLFDLPAWPTPAQVPSDPETGFRHGPTQDGLAYAPALEEALLRRRNNVPPREFQPSYLHGNPFDPDQTDSAQAHMQRQLFWSKWPGGAAANQFQDVYPQRHDFTPFAVAPTTVNPTGEKLRNYPSNPDYKYWDVMMDAQLAAVASSIVGVAIDYDKRHLATTVSHDDLLARTGMISTPQGRKDLRQAMIEANWTAWDPDNCIDPLLNGVLPFEYVRYPSFGENSNCCPTEPECELEFGDGRLQLSIPWVNERLSAPSLTPAEQERIYRTIHDAFFLLVRNALGPDWEDKAICTSNNDCESGEYCRRGGIISNPGRCSSTAPYWDDIECAVDADCRPGDFYCDTSLNRCIDPWTHQRRNEALIARTAASLTANFIDSADNDDIQTRIAIRNFSFESKCIANSGGTDHNFVCDPTLPNPCPNGGTCPSNSRTAGRDVDLDSTLGFQKQYVYGVEAHPYISEIVTINNGTNLVGWAVEIVNPNPVSINLAQYVLYQVDGAGNVEQPIPLTNDLIPAYLGTAAYPSMTLVTPTQTVFEGITNIPIVGMVRSPGTLAFESGWTLYLARNVSYQGDTNPTPVVVDQLRVAGPNVGVPIAPVSNCGNLAECWYSMERHITQSSIWTLPVPRTWEKSAANVYTLGSWNTVDAPEKDLLHPVHVQSSNSSGGYDKAFPTTGSLLLLPRVANRSIGELTAPLNRKVTSLAYSAKLDEITSYWLLPGDSVATEVNIDSVDQIDNGRMPIFDTGDIPPPPAQPYYAHHVGPQYSDAWIPSDPNSKAAPGALSTIPWGQLVFDYFTALPLSNGGPYAYDWSDPDAPMPVGDQQLPRVDEAGLRVHGRINLNAAPWKVLAGLPLIPLERFNALPVSIVDKVKIAYGDPTNLVDPQPLGPWLAKSIVAYRDARAVVEQDGSGTGDYGSGEKASDNLVTPAPPLYGRGWTNLNPAARRGTGFMAVGELANVRHSGATPDVPAASYRIDISSIDADNTNNNTQDFIEAAAVLIALGDWVSVRSHVFTVYGQIRGADDPTIADPVMRLMDSDARAIRFQETIDRLPVLQGRGKPTRIGERTVGQYTDVNND